MPFSLTALHIRQDLIEFISPIIPNRAGDSPVAKTRVATFVLPTARIKKPVTVNRVELTA